MKKSRTRGFALVSIAIVMAITLTFGLILVDSAFSNRRAAKIVKENLGALEIADAGLKKAAFCLNQLSGTYCGGTAGILYAGETGVSFGGGSYTTTVTGSGTSRSVASTGSTAAGGKSKILATLTSVPRQDDPAFSYALQAGDGGAYLENNSTVNGTLYANGDIICKTTNARITGDAYVSKAAAKIDSCRVDFDAHADKVLGGRVDRNAYFKTSPQDIEGTTVAGTKYPDSVTPASVALPELDLDFWHESAEDGGVMYGDYSPASGTLGPIKIVGNLTFPNNANVTITGPIWVVGDVTTLNNVTLTLDPGFGAYGTVMLADDQSNLATKGKITISNNTTINGSGSPMSHLLFASTNSSTDDVSPALSISNNAAGAVFYALNGTLRLENNAGAKALAGKRLYLDGNAAVTYVQSEFSGAFSNSPSSSWRLLEGTWREGK